MIIDFHTHVFPPEEWGNFTGTGFHKNIGAKTGKPPGTIENVLEAAKIGGVDISVISNPLHNLRDMDREQQLARCQAQNRFHAEQQYKYHGQDRRHGLDGALWRRQVPARIRARHQAGRAQGRVDPLQPAGQLPGRRRGDAVLPARAGARRAGRHPSAVGRLWRGADARLSAGVERRPSDGRCAGGRAADRARRVRKISEAEARRAPTSAAASAR